MKKYFELYDNTKTYYSPIGEVFSPEVIAQRYAIINSGLPVVVETDATGVIFSGYGLLSQFKAMYDIDDTLSDADAITAITTAANTVSSTEPTTEERIASALELQNLLAMSDIA